MVRPAKLEVSEQVQPGRATVSVEGELDLSTVPVLEERVNAQMGSGESALTLDLSGVSFMDSSALRFLIALNERAQDEERAISLIAPQHESARLVLRMTGADKALPFERGAAP